MADVGTAEIGVKIDRSGLNREIDKAGKEIGAGLGKGAKVGLGKAARELSTEAALLAAGVGLLGKSAVDAAIDTGESLNKVAVVFGGQAAEVRKFAEGAASSLGISNRAALEYTGTLGNLLLSTGLSNEQAAEFSTRLVALAGDLGSFNNVPVDDALEAIRSGLVGEQEPLKRFGVNLNEATLKAKAMELGLADGKGVLDANAKAQAAYALILEQTGTAQGDFARTADSLANRQKVVAAEFDNAKAKLGEGLLPLMSQLVGVTSKAVSLFSKVPAPITATALGLSGLGAAAVFVVPKVVDGARAIRDLSGAARDFAASGSRAGKVLGGLGKGATAAAAGLAAYAGTTAALNAIVGAQTNDADIDALGASIELAGKKGELGGELIRAYGDDLSKLTSDIKLLDKSSVDKALSLRLPQAAEKDIDKLDKALAAAVGEGRGDEARRLFGIIQTKLVESGGEAEDAVKEFDDYWTAVEAGETRDAAKGITDTTDALLEQVDALLATTSTQNKFITAQLNVEDAIEAYEGALATAAGTSDEFREAEAAAAQQAGEDARQIQDAHRAVAEAQDRVRQSQLALTDAREAARRKLEDLTFAERSNALSVKESQLALLDAAQQAGEARDDPRTLIDERVQAQLALERAQLSAEQTQAEATRGTQEYNDAIARGVEGSAEVVAAHDAIRDAQQGVTDASNELSAAQLTAQANSRTAAAELKAMQEEARLKAVELKITAQDAIATFVKAAQEAKVPIDVIATGLLRLSALTAPDSELRTHLRDLWIDAGGGKPTQDNKPAWWEPGGSWWTGRGEEAPSQSVSPGHAWLPPGVGPPGESVGPGRSLPAVTANFFGYTPEQANREIGRKVRRR